MVEWVENNWQIFVQIALVIISAIVIVWLVKRTVAKIKPRPTVGAAKISSEQQQRLDTVWKVIISAVRVVVWTVAVMIVLSLLGVQIGPILATAGVASFGLAFGAQNLVKDLISGLFTLLEGHYAIGDVVKIGGVSGVVEDLRLRSAVLRDLQGVVHIIPHSQVGVISNLTHQWSRAVEEFTLARDTDLDQAIGALKEAVDKLKADPDLASALQGEPEIVGLTGFDGSGMTVRVMLKSQPGAQWSVSRAYRTAIRKALAAKNIELGVPRQEVTLDK
jgi:moderate conductance mechanosensitive channel